MSTSIKRESGFTLVELLIAVLVSSIMLTGVIQLFVSSKQSYRSAESLARMQESARYAMDVLARDIRQAGYSPCRKTNKVANTLNTDDEAYNFFDGSVLGYDGANSTFGSDFPAVGTAAGDRVANADAIRIVRGGTKSYSVESHNATSAQFKLDGSHDLEDGDILIVCDADNTAVFQISNSNQANVTIVHNTGDVVSPGNCTKGLGFPVPDPCDDVNGTAYTYGPGSQVAVFRSFVYYIGVSQSGTTNSLYRRAIANVGGDVGLSAADELAEGVESMQVVYGEADNPYGAATNYVTADNVTDWNNVVSVRMGLLMHTPDEISTTDDGSTYTVVGEDVTAPSDRRQRYVFTSTVQIRNRGIAVESPG